MKRMYVTLFIISVIMIWAVTGLGQMISQSDKDVKVLPDQTQTRPKREPFDRMKRRMELRAEMHRRMMDKLFNGVGPDEDMFSDMEKMFEDAMTESFSGLDQFDHTMSFSRLNSNFKSHWEESKEGRILIITPQDKDQKLNIDVNNSMITIKGESRQKNGDSEVMTSFNNSISVPQDCDGSRVKMDSKDGDILIILPFKTEKKITAPSQKTLPQEDNGRKPIEPEEGDITI